MDWIHLLYIDCTKHGKYISVYGSYVHPRGIIDREEGGKDIMLRRGQQTTTGRTRYDVTRKFTSSRWIPTATRRAPDPRTSLEIIPYWLRWKGNLRLRGNI